MTSLAPWLAAQWSFVRTYLPEPPARVLDVGCGSQGGFVPILSGAGYAAVGIDPEAPDGPSFRRIPFEDYEPPRPVDAIVACTSLHHVADLDLVLARAEAALARDGVLIVVEYAWERCDEATATWCFARLPADGAGWLHRHRAGWIESGKSWPDYRSDFATAEGLHRGETIVRALDLRFQRRTYARVPYFFSDLGGVTEADEQAAIDAGEIQAAGIRYVAWPQGT